MLAFFHLYTPASSPLSAQWKMDEEGRNILEGPANSSDFNSPDNPCSALERVNNDDPNILSCLVLSM
jgi:hypothetical protein